MKIKEKGLQFYFLFLGSCAIGLCAGLALSIPTVMAVLQPVAGALFLRQLGRHPTVGQQCLHTCLFVGAFLCAALFWLGLGIYRPPANTWWTSAGLFLIVMVGQVALYLACFLLLRWLTGMRRHPTSVARTGLCMGATFTLAELLRSAGTLALPWAFWGYGAIDNPLLRGLYPLGGSYLVSTALWLLSAWLLVVAKGIRTVLQTRAFRALRPSLRAVWPGTVACLILSATALVEWTQAKPTPLHVRLVHTHWPSSEKYLPHNQALALRMLQSAPHASSATLTIFPELFWPERISAIPYAVRTDISEQTHTQKRALLFGAVGVAHDAQAPAKTEIQQNTLFLLDAEGGSQRYAKRLLLPFTEYLPHTPWLNWAWPYLYRYPLADLAPGPAQPQPMNVRGVRLGTLICSELAAPILSVLEGAAAEIVVSPANDAWIPSPLFLQQAHHLARVRAAELQKPVVRANNVGVSAFIDHRGNVLDSLQGGAGSGEWLVQARSGQTPYARLMLWLFGPR